MLIISTKKIKGSGGQADKLFMKSIIFIPFLILISCNFQDQVSSESQRWAEWSQNQRGQEKTEQDKNQDKNKDSDRDSDRDCEKIDLFFDCYYNKFMNFYDSGHSPDYVRSQNIDKQCLKELDLDTSQEAGLDTAFQGSVIANKCKNSVYNYIGQRDFLTQFLYCLKREVKKEHCP